MNEITLRIHHRFLFESDHANEHSFDMWIDIFMPAPPTEGLLIEDSGWSARLHSISWNIPHQRYEARAHTEIEGDRLTKLVERAKTKWTKMGWREE